jgi:surfeit locus 1 family protein
MTGTMTQHRAGHRRGQQVIIWGIGLVVTAVMLGLGLWQMQSFRDTGREALIARLHAPAVELTTVAPAGQEPGDAYGRTVRATGTYLPEQQLLIPEPHDPGRFRVLTALQLADGSVVGVVRGISTLADPPPPPTGSVTLLGVFLPTEAEPEQPVPEGQLGTVRLPRIAQLWTQPLVPGFINLDAPGATAQGLTPAEVTLPSNAGHARNQGYALQWWIFAAAAIAATVKLSRDAAKGTGFMASHPEMGIIVENSGDNHEESIESSTAGAPETSTAAGGEPTTVERN